MAVKPEHAQFSARRENQSMKNNIDAIAIRQSSAPSQRNKSNNTNAAVVLDPRRGDLVYCYALVIDPHASPQSTFALVRSAHVRSSLHSDPRWVSEPCDQDQLGAGARALNLQESMASRIWAITGDHGLPALGGDRFTQSPGRSHRRSNAREYERMHR